MDEAPVWISINGTRCVVLTCSPSETDALAVGHVLGNGWIRSGAEVQSLRTVAGPGGSCGVELLLDEDTADAALAQQRHLTVHGCGLRHMLDCDAGRRSITRQQPPHTPPHRDRLAAALRDLFAVADAASPAGGVHAAALLDEGGLHHAAVDVARHCAADRVIGLAALAGDDLTARGMITTSRISGAIALKAVLAGVPWLASRSVATPLAREIAAAGGMPLVERAARREGAS
jgi:formate dehydrogenase accessory protein FdhD